jgi:hypothetical protein
MTTPEFLQADVDHSKEMLLRSKASLIAKTRLYLDGRPAGYRPSLVEMLAVFVADGAKRAIEVYDRNSGYTSKVVQLMYDEDVSVEAEALYQQLSAGRTRTTRYLSRMAVCSACEALESAFRVDSAACELALVDPAGE